MYIYKLRKAFKWSYTFDVFYRKFQTGVDQIRLLVCVCARYMLAITLSISFFHARTPTSFSINPFYCSVFIFSAFAQFVWFCLHQFYIPVVLYSIFNSNYNIQIVMEIEWNHGRYTEHFFSLLCISFVHYSRTLATFWLPTNNFFSDNFLHSNSFSLQLRKTDEFVSGALWIMQIICCWNNAKANKLNIFLSIVFWLRIGILYSSLIGICSLCVCVYM